MRNLVGNRDGKRSFEKPRCWFEDNFKMAIKGIGFKGVNWMQLLQDRVQLLLWTQ
jgi:hypothetical protein